MTFSTRRIPLETLALLLLCVASCAPNIRVLHHSEINAGQEAQEFADVAFVDCDLKEAYALLTPHMQAGYPIKKFEAEILKLHPNGFPSAIQATEYEPLPGQAAMNIFLEGEGESQKFYYRFVMEGTKGDGYKVGGFWRGSGRYPASRLRRPLQK